MSSDLAKLFEIERELRLVEEDSRSQEEQELLVEVLWQETLRLQELSQAGSDER